MARHRTARVLTNETCNQNCAFCDTRRPRERREVVAPAALRSRLADAAADELVLTGGEPTLRRDLPAVVRIAKTRARTVVLETNGALLDAERLRALRDAGLDRLRVHLPDWAERCDAITRDPGGFAATRGALEEAERLGLAFEIATPIVAANAPHLTELAEHVARLAPRRWVLGVPHAGAGTLELRAGARALERAEAAARRLELPVALEAHTHVPPCLFEAPARMAHLFSLTPGGGERRGHARRPACSGCVAEDRCPGIPLAATLDGEPEPIRQDRVRRRLSLISTPEAQIARELFQDEVERLPGGSVREVRTVRVGFRCNQSCDFCFVSTHLPAAERDAVRGAIDEAAAAGMAIALSGGEPTLDPELARWARLAKAAGAPHVEVQTNATRLGDAVPVAPLLDAGVDLFFVSLHGSSAEVCDAVTGAPGTFVKTVRGLDALVAAGAAVRANFVLCATNRRDLVSTVELLASRWPGVELAVSFVAPSPDVVPRTAELIPRYTDVADELSRAIERADELGVVLRGFDSMCGMPLCLVPADHQRFFALAEAPDGYGRGEVFFAEACAECALRGRCFGLRQGYAALHGTDELRPVPER